MGRHFTAVVAGMGPAGMAAAVELSACGVQTAIIDEAALPGGQVYRQAPAEFSHADGHDHGPRQRIGRRLLAEFAGERPRLTGFERTAVWGAFQPFSLSLRRNGCLEEISFERLVICEGALERTVPFPGWSLPGVFSLGGLQRMLKNQGMLPGRRIMLAGSGPLLLAVAAEAVRAGGSLAAVCEALKGLRLGPLFPELLRQPGLLRESLFYLGGLLPQVAALRWGWAVISARGDGRVQEATIARLDQDWRPVPGTEKTLTVDALGVGFGFLPRNRLTRLCGCRIIYDPVARCFRPVIDDHQRTSRPEIYAAGDGAGISGADMSEIQGRLAGLHAARSLGRMGEDRFQELARPLLRKKKRLQRYAEILGRLFTPRDGIFQLMDADTVVCRCEGVTAGRLWEQIEAGCTSLIELKPDRLALGPCQGRVCESTVAEMLRLKGIPPEGIRPLGLRPPLSPLTLAELEDFSNSAAAKSYDSLLALDA